MKVLCGFGMWGRSGSGVGNARIFGLFILD